MFFEYAIEPSVFSTWQNARFFLDALGPWKGRFLADFPRKKWLPQVLASMSCGENEKKAILNRLEVLKKNRGFVRRPGTANGGPTQWLESADAEHAQRPFRAVVTSGPAAKAYHLTASLVDETHELWRVEHGMVVVREPKAIAAALELLIRVSTHVVIVDPYFQASKPHKRAPLVELCRVARPETEIDVYWSDQADRMPSATVGHQEAERELPRALLPGRKVRIRCWRERVGGPRLHNRYVLTDVGGVQFGDSIETGQPGHEDHLQILPRSSHATYWAQYVSMPAFENAIPGTTGTTVVGRSQGRQ